MGLFFFVDRASNQLKTGMTTYITDPPAFIPFRQINNCFLITALKHLQNSTMNNTTVMANITRINKEISMYNGRKITISKKNLINILCGYIDIYMHIYLYIASDYE